MNAIGKVEDVFELSGRAGLVVVPGLINEKLSRSVRVGDSITITNPDGTLVETCIAAFELPRSMPPLDYTPIVLGPDVRRSELQVGATIALAAVKPNKSLERTGDR